MNSHAGERERARREWDEIAAEAMAVCGWQALRHVTSIDCAVPPWDAAPLVDQRNMREDAVAMLVTRAAPRHFAARFVEVHDAMAEMMDAMGGPRQPASIVAPDDQHGQRNAEDAALLAAMAIASTT